MEFEETDKELEDEHVSPDDLLTESSIDDIIDLEAPDTEDEILPELDAIKKDRARKRSLNIRRKIEKILEEKRIKKELDYLFDDDSSSSFDEKEQR